MKAFFNFQTGKAINPLEKIDSFYCNPYKPDNMRLLNLADSLKDGATAITSVTPEGYVITLFAINLLVKGDCLVEWKSQDSFCINNSIWCKIMGKKRDIIRIDTVCFS